MENRRKLYCYHDMIRFMTEEILKGCSHDQTSHHGKRYEVRIYKAHIDDCYVSHLGDCFQSYEEYDEYISFFFETFEQGIYFMSMIPEHHPEYRERVVRKIKRK